MYGSLLRRAVVVAAVAATGSGLVACGSGGNDNSGSSGSSSTPTSTPSSSSKSSSKSSSSSGSGGGAGLKIAAVEKNGLSFDKKTLTAKAGKVTITMDNPSSDTQPHAVAVEGNGVDKDGKVVQPGGTSTVSVTLKPGKYTFYCPVPGHRQAGMEGTLTVQ